ncbi:MAG: hypothetical protein JXA77_12810 [Bacteroidales bacterium]|nr:hypothetical protein [Bacteroidales bacterium]MBN2820473.1 hypothetical protein [Bacteroidales bacterium]
MLQINKAHNIKLLYYVVAVIFLFSACIDDDIKNIEDNVIFSPEYSIPVGSDSVTMAEVVDNYPFDLILIPDSLDNLDSLNIFLFDSSSYFSPVYFDYSSDYTYNLGGIANKIDYITSLMLRLNCINGIPARVQLQVYFLNQFEIALDSVFQDGRMIIEAATTNDEGEVIDKYKLFKHDIYLDQEFIDIMSQTTTVRVSSRIELVNFNVRHIRYFSENDFWMQLGVRFKLELPVNDVN